jgi:hypothetical protein
MGHFKDCQERIRAFQDTPGSLDDLLKLRKRIYAQESTRNSHLVRQIEELIRAAKTVQTADVEQTSNKWWIATGLTAGAVLVVTYVSAYTLWLNELMAKNEPCVCLCA